jgi:hypothetical protein
MVSTPTLESRSDMLLKQISNYVNKQNSLIGINGMAEQQGRKRLVKLVHCLGEGTIDIHFQDEKIREEEGNLGNV